MYGRFLGGVLTLVFLFGAFGCGSTSPRKGTVLKRDSTEGVVAIRKPDPSMLQTWRVHTIMGSYPVYGDGSFQAEFPVVPSDVRFAFVSKEGDEKNPLYYSYYFPSRFVTDRLKPFVYTEGGKGVRIDARTTALTMVIVNPLLLMSTVEQRAFIADRAIAHPRFRELVFRIEEIKTVSPEIPIRYETTPELFFLSSQILIDTMREIAEELPDEEYQSEGLTPQGISYDYDMAYPQNIAGCTLELCIKFVNPKMAHYVVGAKVAGDPNSDWVSLIYVPGKERWLKIDIRVFPPSIRVEVVPPVEIPPGEIEGLNAGAFLLYIYKGFQFDFPFQTLWNTRPARLAMLANVYAAWMMMIALAADLTQILVGVFYGGTGAKQLVGLLNFLDDRIFNYNNQVPLEQLWNTVQTRDRIQTINSMYQVFVAVLPAVEQALKDRARQLYDDATSFNIGTIFQGVWSLVSGGSIVNAIIDITTQIIPFYYDLFTAHGYAVYPLFGGTIQDLPNNPTVSRVYPVNLYNGKNASAVGFGFGATPGQIFLQGSRNNGLPYSDIPILSWTPSQILFKVPADEQGKDIGGTKVVYLKLKTSDGKDTNEMMVPLRYSPPGQDSGGGCTISSSPSASPFFWIFLLTLGIGWLIFRRKVA